MTEAYSSFDLIKAIYKTTNKLNGYDNINDNKSALTSTTREFKSPSQPHSWIKVAFKCFEEQKIIK
jgi:hypothetical protein